MNVRVEKVRPVIQIETEIVIAWEFRVHAWDADPAADPRAFDDVRVDVPAGFRKPLSAWRRAEYDAMIADALRSHPKCLQLYRVFAARKETRTLDDFDPGSLT